MTQADFLPNLMDQVWPASTSLVKDWTASSSIKKETDKNPNTDANANTDTNANINTINSENKYKMVDMWWRRMTPAAMAQFWALYKQLQKIQIQIQVQMQI